jgi:glucose/arabinose dehydrogenase
MLQLTHWNTASLDPAVNALPIALSTPSTPESAAIGLTPSIGQALVIVDSQVEGYESLIAGLDPRQVLVLNAQQSGLDQITTALASYQNLDAVHLISHGTAGQLQLGSDTLDRASLGTNQASIQSWGQALSAQGDILIYGCNVAADGNGQALIQSLAQITGADVAASTDVTGQAALGGDSDLEVTTGTIEARSLSFATYNGTLPTYNGKDYRLTTNARTWEEAQAEAVAAGGNLVTINNAAEQTWVWDTFGKTRALWIGLTDKVQEGQWRWASGEALAYTNWIPGEPNSFGGEQDYAVIGSANGQWDDQNDGTGGSWFFNGSAWVPSTPVGVIEINAPAPNNNFTYNGKQYRLTSGAATTWDQAQSEAQAAGGNLVTINNAAEETWLKQTFGSTEGLWIGITDRLVEGQFTWVNGEAVTYTNWAPGEPNNANGNQDYGVMNFGANRQWDDEFGTTQRRGIIEIGAITNVDPTYNGNRYRLTTNLTWEQAQTEAQRVGGNLVTVNDAAEETWLKQTFGSTEGLWIGINDRRIEGQFEWVNGETSAYRNWAPGEPNNANGDQDYGVMNFGANRQWDDEFSSTQRRGIIEIPGTPTRGSIALEQNTYSVNEAGGGIDIALVRSGNSSGAATILYRTDNGTGANGALNGSDFTAQSGTLSFAPGETRKLVRIPVLNDNLVEGNETFGFVIESPSGADLGTQRTAVVTILDDDNPALTVNNIQVNENAGNAVLTLTRGSGVGTASVQYATANGTAIAGSDYTSRTGTVSFAAGQTSQTLAIPLTNDSTGEANETFQVNFSNPTGITLPNPSATVTIIDDDPGNFVNETIVSGLSSPTAIAWSPDNSLLFALEKSGVIKVIQNGQVVSTFADLSSQVNSAGDRGALGLAINPNFYNGSPYLYISYTYDPPEADRTGSTANDLDNADGGGNRPARVVRLTANTTNYRSAVANSEFILIGKNSTWANTNRPDGDSTVDFSIPESGRTAGGGYLQDYIKTDSNSHTIGSLTFGADGALYVSVGDGTSYNNIDPRAASVLSPDSLSGKILRIDAITGNGLSDNPFWDGNATSNRSKVWNSGLRNPFRTTMKPGTSTLFIGDVGWKTWEEVNVGNRGANFGWSAYEGGTTTGISTGTPTSLRQPEYDAANIPAIEAFYASGQAVTAPIFARNHSEGARAIVVGDFYDGNSFPSIYNGALFIADANEGTIDALTLDSNNQVTAVRRFASGQGGVVQMTTGADGNLYYVNVFTGVIGRWRSI